MHKQILFEVSPFEAEELFKVNGYLKTLSNENMIVYIKTIDNTLMKRIDFDLNKKAFYSFTFNIAGEEVNPGSFNEEELHAIIRQAYELGWTI